MPKITMLTVSRHLHCFYIYMLMTGLKAQKRKMRRVAKTRGTALLVAVFISALLATIVVAMMNMDISQLKLVKNQINKAQSRAVAEAGLNDAIANLRDDEDWRDGFDGKSLPEAGSYSVELTPPGESDVIDIVSTGTAENGFVTVVEAQVTVSDESPKIIVEDVRIR